MPLAPFSYIFVLACVSDLGRSLPTCPRPLFSSCELGSSGASLLGTGVAFRAVAFFKNDFFIEAGGLGVAAAFAFEVDASASVAGLLSVLASFFSTGSPLVGVFEKKPRMELWFLLEATLLPCFFPAGVGLDGVVVSDLFVFAMMTVVVEFSLADSRARCRIIKKSGSCSEF